MNRLSMFEEGGGRGVDEVVAALIVRRWLARRFCASFMAMARELKASLRDYLKGSPYVAEFRAGDRAEGGDGVTIATLR
jgi:hypothetical protein